MSAPTKILYGFHALGVRQIEADSTRLAAIAGSLVNSCRSGIDLELLARPSWDCLAGHDA